MKIFKRNVSMVEFEPHAFCNRRCSFCPNSILDRYKNKTLFDLALYEKTIGELSFIDYDQTIRFSRYSEPLACEEICNYIRLARDSLPKTSIDVVTNGDFLTDKMVAELREAGLSILRISIYPDKDSRWSHENATSKVNSLSKRIALDKHVIDSGNDLLRWVFPYEGMEIYADAKNLNVIGFDRGQSVPSLVDRGFMRASPCFFVFSNITIDYNGAIMPCCNLISDFSDHEEFIIDQINNHNSIYDIYFGKKLTAWRRKLVMVGDKASPCDTCKQKCLVDQRELSSLSRKIKRKLMEIDVTL
jgi:radical SAM protein with 4Fe4S-binding SPASM domain